MFWGFTNSIICLMTLIGFLCSLVGCAHQKTPADEMRLVDNAADADVRKAVQRFLDVPESAALFSLSYRQLLLLSSSHGPAIVEQLLRQGTARRAKLNSDDDPYWLVLSFLRLGVVTWSDTFTVCAELMKSEDPLLKESAKGVVDFLLIVLGSELEDADVVAYLKGHPLEQNKELVEWMVQVAPERALRILSDPAFMPLEEGRQLLWAGHLLEEIAWRESNHFSEKLPADKQVAIEQIRMLAGRQEWWARYYAADILHRYQLLSDPATEQKLRNDPDPHVREAMNPTFRELDAPPPGPRTPEFPMIGGRMR